ncbi:single-stranded DNA-binding protein [Acholeplasma laidlawii]|jgi:single-strand DNA-binding protein|uniref:single-stranded DNA-binding protein n=1 Tax=Acholeplasma laidlawii TaxID=2148 RepID=UPI0018C28163|nr:single-stranded DNA-binding protein [Acholeplasma laidlawii]MBG0762083.1 single-stranded DNA-binding protein [Acholeplasma laidlawii]WIF89183.1 single-stranded DNA-binding protein [Acholeplasma laidlawii]
MTFVNLIGRVVSFDPKESDNGVKYTDLRVSVMRPYKNYDGNYDTDYFRVALFEQNHKRAQDYFRKGMGIAIKGRLEVSKWIDDQDKNRTNVNIIAEHVIFLPREIEEYSADLNS